jgi:hypothetical protein
MRAKTGSSYWISSAQRFGNTEWTVRKSGSCYRFSLAAMTALILAATAGAQPVITLSKYFKGSRPETTIITINKNGDAIYKEAINDDQPLKFQLTESETAEIFALAGKLGHFTREIESGLKVANMGLKTFRFEDGAVKQEVKFNYSQDLDAQALLDWFERISATEQHYVDLDRAVHFDKLGVNQSLLLLQVEWEKKRLVAPQQFLPLLDRVIKNESYLHMARERAATLADTFRSLKTAQVQTP